MKLPSISSVWISFGQTVRRFPIPTVCSILFTLTAILCTHNDYAGAELYRYLYLLFCSCFGFITLALVVERGRISSQKPHIIRIVTFALTAWIIFSHKNIQPLNCLAVASILLMFVAPYLRYTAENDHMWTFCYRLSLRIAFTFLAAVTLYLGMVLVLSSVSYLLIGHFVNDHTYWHLWLFVAAFFSPMLAMAGIPAAFDESEETYPKFLRILLTYIVLPLWAVYIGVLYLYMLKIIMLSHLPNGQVGYFVSAFGAVTVAIYLKGYPLFRQGEKGLATLFSRFGFPLLVAPLILLAISISRRIHAYGMTEDRYMVILCLIWLAASIAIQWRDDAKAPRRIFLTAIALLVLSTFGPWGMSSVSIHNQMARLKEKLEENHILVNGLVVKAVTTVPRKDVAIISDSIDYFVNSGMEDYLQPMFRSGDDSPFVCKETCSTLYDYQYKDNLKHRIGTALGIEYLNQWERSENYAPFPQGFLNFTTGDAAYPVKGYDYAVNLTLPSCCNNPTHQSEWAITPKKPGFATVDDRKNINFSCAQQSSLCTLVVSENTPPLLFDIGTLMTAYEKENKLKGKSDSYGIMEVENAYYSAKLVITHYQGSRMQDKKLSLSNLKAVLLVKSKHD